MEKEQLTNAEEIQLHRLIAFANFLSGIKMEYPLDKCDSFVITKINRGYDIESDNFTFTWAIGLLPLAFGRFWAYSKREKVILKGIDSRSTTVGLQKFFGLTVEEYFHLFVAYFQNTEALGGKILSHNLTTGEDIGYNIREFVKIKMKTKIQTF